MNFRAKSSNLLAITFLFIFFVVVLLWLLLFFFSALLLILIQLFFSIYSGAARKRRSSRHAVCSVGGLFVSSRWNTRGHHQVRATLASFSKTMLQVLYTCWQHVRSAVRGNWKRVRVYTPSLSHTFISLQISLDYFRLVSVREAGTSLVVTVFFDMQSVSVEERFYNHSSHEFWLALQWFIAKVDNLSAPTANAEIALRTAWLCRYLFTKVLKLGRAYNFRTTF